MGRAHFRGLTPARTRSALAFKTSVRCPHEIVGAESPDERTELAPPFDSLPAVPHSGTRSKFSIQVILRKRPRVSRVWDWPVGDVPLAIEDPRTELAFMNRVRTVRLKDCLAALEV